MSLEIIGGEDKLVFRRRHEKGEIVLAKKGPREIIGLPGEWIDGVISVDRHSDLLEEVLDYLENSKHVDRIIIKVLNPQKRIYRMLNNRDFVHMGLNNYLKVVSDELKSLI